MEVKVCTNGIIRYKMTNVPDITNYSTLDNFKYVISSNLVNM